MKEQPSVILQELESDDELPDVYSDVTILPAYLDNNRFDEIKFAWVNNVNLRSNETHSNISSKIDHDVGKTCEKRYMKGLLKGKDLYCLKSIEQFTCSSTLIWFINFLLFKDLNSHYNNYLRSCLVNDFISTSPTTKKINNHSEEPNLTERFEIVIRF